MLATILKGQSPLILDGGLATTLEAQGAELDSELWPARLLKGDPESIRQAHIAFAEAGAQTPRSESQPIGTMKTHLLAALLLALILGSCVIPIPADGFGQYGYSPISTKPSVSSNALPAMKVCLVPSPSPTPATPSWWKPISPASHLGRMDSIAISSAISPPPTASRLAGTTTRIATTTVARPQVAGMQAISATWSPTPTESLTTPVKTAS